MKSSSTADSNDLIVPWLKIATKVTRARPIIRAEAVDAVRDGFRVALSRARIPGARPHDPRGVHRDAEEQQQDAPAEQKQPQPSREVGAETPERNAGDGRGEDDQRRHRTVL